MTPRIAHSFRHTNFVAAIVAAALIAAACGGEDAPAVIDTPSDTAATTTVVETPVREEHPCNTGEGQIEGNYCLVDGQWYADAGAGHWVESDGPPVTTTTVAAMTEEEIVEIQQEIAEVVEDASPEDMPPVEVAEQVIEAAEEAAPETELNLGICTQWVADPELVLNEQQAQECAAMLAAAVEACEGLNCFGDDGTEPEPEPEPEETPTTTAPPEPEEQITTSAPSQPEPENRRTDHFHDTTGTRAGAGRTDHYDNATGTRARRHPAGILGGRCRSRVRVGPRPRRHPRQSVLRDARGWLLGLLDTADRDSQPFQ